MNYAPAQPISAGSTLNETLTEAGWGPRDLTKAVNAWLTDHGRGNERVDVTAAYPWVRANYCPQNDIPAVVATVLTKRLGRFVSAEQLWPGHTRAERVSSPEPLWGTGSIDDSLRSLDRLAAQQRPTVTTPTDLATAVIAALRDPVEAPSVTRSRDRVHRQQAELIATHVTALRQLDDHQGGGVLNLRYVSRQLSSVLDLFRQGSCEPEVADSLLTSVADLAQLAGWMHFDAGSTDTGQHYLVLGIRLSRATSDTGRAANSAGMLAYIAAETGAAPEAVAIAESAAAMESPSPLHQARAAGRLATAHAAAGNALAFRQASDRAHELLETARSDPAHPYLYYLTHDQLDAEAGSGLARLALRTDVHRRQLLTDASQLLAPRARLARDPGYRRSAVLHGCQLAEVHLMMGELDGVVAAARGAAELLPEVQSGRCATKLRALHRALLQRRRSRVVAEFLPELEEALRA